MYESSIDTEQNTPYLFHSLKLGFIPTFLPLVSTVYVFVFLSDVNLGKKPDNIWQSTRGVMIFTTCVCSLSAIAIPRLFRHRRYCHFTFYTLGSSYVISWQHVPLCECLSVDETSNIVIVDGGVNRQNTIFRC